MLGKTKGKMICQCVPDYVLFDLETTGISCNYDEVIEISALKVRNGAIVDEFNELVCPGRPIPRETSMVNHITDQMVEGAPSFKEILPRFIEFIGDDVLAGHNIHTFDMKFLYRDCEKYFGQALTNDYMDTLRLSKIVFPDWRHRRLSDLAEYYGISTVGAHRALTDCYINQQVLELMAKEWNTSGVQKRRADMKICPKCGQPMKKRNGRFGEFWGCSGYPNCRYTENI